MTTKRVQQKEKPINVNATIKVVFDEMFSRLKSEFQIAATSVYEYRKDTMQIEFISGEKLNNVVIDKYLSYENSTVLINSEGTNDNNEYKSRFVSHIEIGKIVYLIVLSSYGLEAFRSKTPQYIIEALTAAKRKVGTINELCPC